MSVVSSWFSLLLLLLDGVTSLSLLSLLLLLVLVLVLLVSSLSSLGFLLLGSVILWLSKPATSSLLLDCIIFLLLSFRINGFTKANHYRGFSHEFSHSVLTEKFK